MSGTSLDGVDVAVCSFFKNNSIWGYDLLHSKTFLYENYWKKALKGAPNLNSEELAKMDRIYGDYLGHIVNTSVEESGIKSDLVASHGHTIFHKPDEGYSLQIGHGANITTVTGLDVVSDFRSTDIANGGQGAPLVPVGDKLLFGNYQACLNLGGFSNISFDFHGKRLAFDVCPVNIVLNYYANKLGHEYDNGGIIGMKGKVSIPLLNRLNSMPYYSETPPKSLSREWIETELLHVMESVNCSLEDKLCTFYQHISNQIVTTFVKYDLHDILVTGGGVHNGYLMQMLIENSTARLKKPDSKTIDYKEAIVFAFLGLLRYLGQINCYASVTGAKSDTVCGSLYCGQK